MMTRRRPRRTYRAAEGRVGLSTFTKFTRAAPLSLNRRGEFDTREPGVAESALRACARSAGRESQRPLRLRTRRRNMWDQPPIRADAAALFPEGGFMHCRRWSRLHTTAVAVATILTCSGCATGPLNSPSETSYHTILFGFSFDNADPATTQNAPLGVTGDLAVTVEGTSLRINGTFVYIGYPAGAAHWLERSTRVAMSPSPSLAIPEARSARRARSCTTRGRIVISRRQPRCPTVGRLARVW